VQYWAFRKFFFVVLVGFFVTDGLKNVFSDGHIYGKIYGGNRPDIEHCRANPKQSLKELELQSILLI
jgi:hypothetical protein